MLPARDPYCILTTVLHLQGWIWIVAGFMLLQALVILVQEHIDPCFFLPSRMSRAQPYNYHPAIPLPDPEAPEQTLGDCAICMEAILVDPSLSRRSKSSDTKERPAIALQVPFLKKVGTAKSKKTYSLAPCHHLFVSCFSIPRWVLGDARVALTFLEIAHRVSGAGKSSLSCVAMYREGI